jgi:deoxyribodipyrimidine photo-lyase
LSPYLSRGVISTRQVYAHLKSLDVENYKTQVLIKELAWRDYFQQVWLAKGEAVLSDMNQPQSSVLHHGIPKAIVDANTGIEAIDNAITELYATGYMHNHMRMYIASLCCNIAKCHWLQPARWLYSQLLDGDIASNHLSWQWIASSFSQKKYFANQDNINHFFYSTQKNTFLDVDYPALESMAVPAELSELSLEELPTHLPNIKSAAIQKNITTLVYNYYNLDPYWHQNEELQRILLLEPSHFKKYSVGKKNIEFALELAKNIDGIKIVVDEFETLKRELDTADVIYKEHPAFVHYSGTKEPREWMGEQIGYYPSFSSFWKNYKKTLQ